jgi:hypothetical protein
VDRTARTVYLPCHHWTREQSSVRVLKLLCGGKWGGASLFTAAPRAPFSDVTGGASNIGEGEFARRRDTYNSPVFCKTARREPPTTILKKEWAGVRIPFGSGLSPIDRFTPEFFLRGESDYVDVDASLHQPEAQAERQAKEKAVVAAKEEAHAAKTKADADAAAEDDKATADEQAAVIAKAAAVTTVQVNIHQIGITTSSSMTTFVNLERGLPTTILELFPLVFCARASWHYVLRLEELTAPIGMARESTLGHYELVLTARDTAWHAPFDTQARHSHSLSHNPIQSLIQPPRSE